MWISCETSVPQKGRVKVKINDATENVTFKENFNFRVSKKKLSSSVKEVRKIFVTSAGEFQGEDFKIQISSFLGGFQLGRKYKEKNLTIRSFLQHYKKPHIAANIIVKRGLTRYKRGTRMTQTFPMFVQDDCLKFLLKKNEKILHNGTKFILFSATAHQICQAGSLLLWSNCKLSLVMYNVNAPQKVSCLL